MGKVTFLLHLILKNNEPFFAQALLKLFFKCNKKRVTKDGKFLLEKLKIQKI